MRNAPLVGVVLVFLLVGFVSTPTAAAATNHYVDNSLVTGANDGSSWPNAWRSFAAINWASISAGDTIFVSGGSTSQTYSETFTFGKSGTAGNLITLRIGQDTGHNGLAIIQSNYIDARQNYVAIDGNYGGSQHIWIQDWVNTTSTFANCILADSSVGFQCSYVGFSNVNNCAQIIGARGFTFNHLNGIHIRGDGAIRAANSIDQGYDSHFVQYSSFGIDYNTNNTGYLGPDGVQASYGITVRYNQFYLMPVGYQTSTQHPDYTQITGNHIKIYGNDFLNIGDSANDFDWWVNTTPGDIMIYNNTYRRTDNPRVFDIYPEYIRWYSTAASQTSVNNILIANNTFIDDTIWSDLLSGNWPGNPTLSSWIIANNIHVNGGAMAIQNNPSMVGSNPLGFTHNIYPNGGSWQYRGSTWNGTSWLAVEPDRIVGQPSFVAYTPFDPLNDLHLAAGDTVARGQGVDLSAYFTTDKDGNVRTAPWDVGAYAFLGGSLIAPNTPSNVTPGAGATGVSITPTLTGSGYSDSNIPTSAQTDAQFQVYQSDGTTLVWDSGTGIGAVTSKAVGTTLSYSTTYKWQCRYRNASLFSSYSPQTSFTTTAAPATPYTLNATISVNAGKITYP